MLPAPNSPATAILTHGRINHARTPSEFGGGSSRNGLKKRRCKLDGRFCIARAISSLPRRSAIRMVAEFNPFVDFSSFLRNSAGTSFTDR